MNPEKPVKEKEPSAVLHELGFTPTGVTDPEEEPNTFDIVIGMKETVAIAYDQNYREWSLAGVDADEMERTLLGKGFSHGASPFSPKPEDPRN